MSISKLSLTTDNIAYLRNLASVINISPSENPELYCDQTRKLSTLLPKTIQSTLQNFAKQGSPTGFLLMETIPIPTELPPTPPNSILHIGEITELAKIQGIFMQSISEMLSYEAEGNGHLYQDIVPNQSMAKNQTSLGSNTELEIHTEQAFSTLRPDFLCLACLRGDPDAYTHIFPVQTILDNITDTEKSLLREPLWKTGVDLSFKLHGKEFLEGDMRGPMPILHGTESDPLLIFDQDLMRGITEPADKMIKKIVDIYYKHRIRHRLSPGEIMIVDNRRAVHGRSPFFPKYNGEDRFLIRCFSRLDHGSTAHARPNNGRMVAAIYS